MSRERNRGFTLIELLVVVAIVGILAAIATAQFNEYRRKAFDASANHDLRAAATAEEAYYATHQTYLAGTLATGFLPGFVLSATVSGAIDVVTGTSPTFNGTATSSDGTGMVFSYDSALGGMLN